MNNINSRNFGIIIAFLLPGFVVLFALSDFIKPIRENWFGLGSSQPTAASFLLILISSLALGMFVTSIRWVLIDYFLGLIHSGHFIGGKSGKLDFSKLTDPNVANAYEIIVENHYRYYQYYSGMLIAILILLTSQVYKIITLSQCDFLVLIFNLSKITMPCLIVMAILLVAARDANMKYIQKGKEILDANGNPKLNGS